MKCRPSNWEGKKHDRRTFVRRRDKRVEIVNVGGLRSCRIDRDKQTRQSHGASWVKLRSTATRVRQVDRGLKG